ncbi:MAG TPA: hypothetical protein VHE81_00805 [Lacipirellulaceae bacterium]|nr:hypothetical protein [Lacipirellulaceae bacterium]
MTSTSHIRGSQVLPVALSELNSTTPDSSESAAKELIDTSSGSHDIANEVARTRGAQAAVWGSLSAESNGYVTVAVSLTIPEATSDQQSWLTLPTSDIAKRDGLAVPYVAINRLNFAAATANLADLYGHHARVRCARADRCPPGSLSIYERPDMASASEAISEGDDLTIDIDASRRPTGKFVPVRRLADGRQGWVFAYHLDFAPSNVFVSKDLTAKVYSSPNFSTAPTMVINGPRLLAVQDMRLVELGDNKVRWYLVALPSGGAGWVSHGRVKPVWATNAIHFIAAIHAYSRGYYQSAREQLEIFLNKAAATKQDRREDNVVLSAANQLMAASIIANQSVPSLAATTSALKYIDASVSTTPFDSASFYVRAYAKYAWRANAELSTHEIKSIESDLVSAQKLRIDGVDSNAYKESLGKIDRSIVDLKLQ